MHEARVNDANEITITSYSISPSTGTNEYTFSTIASTSNPFATGTFTDAFYKYYDHDDTEPLKFFMFGYTTSVGSADFSAAYTGSK